MRSDEFVRRELQPLTQRSIRVVVTSEKLETEIGNCRYHKSYFCFFGARSELIRANPFRIRSAMCSLNQVNPIFPADDRYDAIGRVRFTRVGWPKDRKCV